MHIYIDKEREKEREKVFFKIFFMFSCRFSALLIAVFSLGLCLYHSLSPILFMNTFCIPLLYRKDELARLLLRTRRLGDATQLLKRLLTVKAETYGAHSVEAADTHQLFGAVRLAQVWHRLGDLVYLKYWSA